jgi:hypothetical protein
MASAVFYRPIVPIVNSSRIYLAQGRDSNCVPGLICKNINVEKHMAVLPVRELRNRKNPWLQASYIERLQALTQIVFPKQDHESTQSGFPRVYRVARGKRG